MKQIFIALILIACAFNTYQENHERRNLRRDEYGAPRVEIDGETVMPVTRGMFI